MATSSEKFKKLLAAYEDDVLRKQHRMGKRVYPVDEVRPLPSTGYCSFIRGQQAIWTPSYEVIGTFVFLSPESSTALSTAEVPSSGRQQYDQASFVGDSNWRWSWADEDIDPQLRSRIDEVRSQGQVWGIDELTTGRLRLLDEQQAWELALVAVALSRAEALYRHQRPTSVCYLALFEGPPLRRSPSMRMTRDAAQSTSERMSSSYPAALARTPTGPIGSRATSSPVSPSSLSASSSGSRSVPPTPTNSRTSPPSVVPSSMSTSAPSVPRTIPPAPSRSSTLTSMAGMSVVVPPPPALPRVLTPAPDMLPSPPTGGSSARIPTPAPGMTRTVPPATLRSTPSGAGTSKSTPPGAMPSRSGGLAQTWGASLPTAEPTLDTRRVLGLRMADCVPYGLRGQRRTVVLNGKIRPPSGPIGSISFDLQMILKSCDHGPDLSLQPSPALLDCLSGLWLRCRDANTPFRGVYARLEPILDRMADPIDGESTLGDPMGTSRDAWSTLVVLEA